MHQSESPGQRPEQSTSQSLRSRCDSVPGSVSLAIAVTIISRVDCNVMRTNHGISESLEGINPESGPPQMHGFCDVRCWIPIVFVRYLTWRLSQILRRCLSDAGSADLVLAERRSNR